MPNLDPAAIIAFFAGSSPLYLFFKLGGIVFSLVFLIYTVIIHKQVQEITHTITNSRNSLFILISFCQVLFVLGFLLFAIVIL